MVYFVCMQCQETLKRNAVDKHCLRCRDCWDLCCVDCNKIFSGEDFRKHVTCISEAERYQGALYRPKKGHNKATPQEIWTHVIQTIAAAPPADMASDEQHLLRLVSGMSNVPRKLKKFNNICKNSFRNAAKLSVVESLFAKFDAAFKANREAKQEETKKAAAAKETSNVLSAAASVEVAEVAATTTTTTTTAASEFQWKKSLKRLLITQGGEMKVKKARKMVFKDFLASNPTNLLTKEQVKKDFVTLCKSSKFVFNEKQVALAKK